MATCGKCGNALKEGSKFCGTCGWKVPPQAPAPVSAPIPGPSDAEATSLLTSPSAGRPAAAVPPPPAAPPGAPPPPAGPAPAPPAKTTAGPRPPQPAPKKKKSALGCILAVLAILFLIVVLAAGGGAWWYFKGGGAQWVAVKRGKVPMPEEGTVEPPPSEVSPAPYEPAVANEPPPAAEATPSPEPPVSPEPTAQPQPTAPPPPQVKPAPPDSKSVALKAAKENAEVALKSLREAIESAARAGAERASGQAMETLREERRAAERAFQKAKSPSDFEAVASSARKGVARALELKAQAEKAAAPEAPPPEPGMRRSSVPQPSAPEVPAPKQPKANFGFIFETPVNGNKLILKVDGEKLIDQEFQVVQGSYRLAKDFPIAPGQHHLRAAVHQSDGKVIAQDWDFNFQLGSTPVFKVVLENSPRKMTMKKVQ